MIFFKRAVIIALVAALALMGIITASASTLTQDQVLRQQGEAKAWLGVSITDIRNGVTITEVVADSPADEAGLLAGDIITAVGDTKIDSATLLVETIQALAPGDEIELAITRDDEPLTVTVTLAERPAEVDEQPVWPYRPSASGQPMILMLNMFGLTLESTDEGLVVQSIESDSFFADSGLEPGDVITAIDGESVLSGNMPSGIFSHMRFDGPIVFSIVRDGEAMDIEVEFDFDAGDMMPHFFLPESGQGIQVMPAGRPTRLGVRFLTLNADVVKENELTVEQGALITEVYEETPAAAAGLQVDDIILAVNGDVVDEERTLADRLYAYEAGDMVTLTVHRAGEEIEIEVELGPDNSGWMFDGSMQMMPMQPGQYSGRHGFFGHGSRRGQQGSFGFRMPHMDFFYGQPGRFFEMHPFMDGDFFEFHFGGDGGESIQVTPETSDDTPM